LITHPAERVSHTPALNTNRIHNDGTPSAASHNPHQVGHSNSNQPIGRSPRISCQYSASLAFQAGTRGA